MPDTKTCTKCGESKPLDQFSRNARCRDGLDRHCRDCIREKTRRWREANPGRTQERARERYQENLERERERVRRYREENREGDLERKRRYREENPELVRERNRRWREENAERDRERHRRWREENPERGRESGRLRRTRDRVAVFDHYGRSCACCGSTERLNIDHVNGDGRDHRKELFGRRQGADGPFYQWLIANGFPEGFQALCFPCNRSKADGPRCRIDHAAAVIA